MADLSYDELMGLIQKNHPNLAFLLDKPGVRDLAFQIVQAEADGKPWTDQQILDGLHATPWFQNTAQGERDFTMLAATDPATARFKGDQMTNQVLHIAQTLGVTLTPQNQWDIVTSALNNGWGDAEIQHALLFGAAFTGLATTGTGDIAGAAQNVKELAGQYAVPMSDQAATSWALGVKDGVITSDGLKAYMVEQAKSRYPSLADALDRGVTVAQYANPYIQDAVQNLGINEASVDFNDPKWSAMLDGTTDDKGNRTQLSRDQWVQMIRTDPRYGYDTTSQGQLAATQLAEGLSQKFGLTG